MVSSDVGWLVGSAAPISLLLAPLVSVSVRSTACSPSRPQRSAGGKAGAGDGDSAQCHCPAPLPPVLRKRLVGFF